MKTIYEKSLLYYLIAILLGFSFLGLGLTQAFKSYIYSENKRQLLSQAEKISSIYIKSLKDSKLDSYVFEKELNIFDKYSDHSFFVTDNQFKILSASNDIDRSNINKHINSAKNYDFLNKKSIAYVDNFNDLYGNKRFFIAYPIESEDNIGTLGVVFVTTSLNNLHSSIMKAYIISIIFLIIAIIIGFMVLNISMSKTLSGITIINNAAKRIADGDFDQRVRVKGKDEIAQLADNFNYMAESLSTSDKNKQEFLSNIAHDLRSPITSINGFINAILDGTIPPENTDRYLKIIQSETNRLNNLTASISDLNIMAESRNNLNQTSFNISKLLSNTIDTIKSKSYGRNINIVMSFESNYILVFADYEKIQRVLYNLIDNAIKFTNDGGSITAKISKSQSKAYIEITNTGIGLTEDECKRVFDRLYKADSSRGIDKTGTGLGLAIVREFINAHNETISVKSEPNQTTSFTFSLKLSKNTP